MKLVNTNMYQNTCNSFLIAFSEVEHSFGRTFRSFGESFAQRVFANGLQDVAVGVGQRRLALFTVITFV